MVAQRDRRILTKGSGDKVVPRSQTVAALDTLQIQKELYGTTRIDPSNRNEAP